MLFNHFEILSVLLAPSHLMPLFGLGLQHGLVLDCGDEEATLIPVYQGVPILKAWQALPLASKVIYLLTYMGVFDLTFVSSVYSQLPANCNKWGLL